MEGLYYLKSKNNDPDQLRDCCKADLRLCFHVQYWFSHEAAHFIVLFLDIIWSMPCFFFFCIFLLFSQ